jgi:hypothetical protein
MFLKFLSISPYFNIKKPILLFYSHSIDSLSVPLRVPAFVLSSPGVVHTKS